MSYYICNGTVWDIYSELLGRPIVYLAFCQSLSDFQFSDSLKKLRSFYIKFISITIFYSDSKGSRNCLKVLHFLALVLKGTECISSIFFCGNIPAPYRKTEKLKLSNVLFWVVQNFRPFSRPFRATQEKNY